MKLYLTLISLFFSLNVFGQSDYFLRTTAKRNFHFIVLRKDNAVVYKMARYLDKAGTSPAISKTDTLVLTLQNTFKGKYYTLLKGETTYTLMTAKGEKYSTDTTSEWMVNTELNHACCMKSYIDLSDKLNAEFPLFHYTFRHGFDAWKKHSDKSNNHELFVTRMEKEIVTIYDSISKQQKVYTHTVDFITTNAGLAKYAILKDSMSTLPINYKPISGYFDKSVYLLTKVNPEYFYKLLQDFPSSKKFIYFAVDRDKELVRQLKQVKGYDVLKKEFLREYNFGRTMGYKTLGSYAIFAGLITWLIVAQP